VRGRARELGFVFSNESPSVVVVVVVVVAANVCEQ
jgi:hypothetical protein